MQGMLWGTARLTTPPKLQKKTYPLFGIPAPLPKHSQRTGQAESNS